MSIVVKFFSGGGQSIQIPQTFQGFDYCAPQYFSYCLNWKNVRTEWNNQNLYLSTSGLVFVLVPEGCYFIKDLNDGILAPQISGKYYKIISPPGSAFYYVYSYTSASDRTNNINGVQEITQGFSNLNAEIYYGTFEPNVFKIKCDLFNTWSNTEKEKISCSKTRELLVYSSVIRNQIDTLEFKQDMNFSFDNAFEISFKFTDIRD